MLAALDSISSQLHVYFCLLALKRHQVCATKETRQGAAAEMTPV